MQPFDSSKLSTYSAPSISGLTRLAVWYDGVTAGHIVQLSDGLWTSVELLREYDDPAEAAAQHVRLKLTRQEARLERYGLYSVNGKQKYTTP